MMKDNEILQEIMIAFHAKNTLNKITDYIQKCKTDWVSVQDILNIIEQEDDVNDCF